MKLITFKDVDGGIIEIRKDLIEGFVSGGKYVLIGGVLNAHVSISADEYDRLRSLLMEEEAPKTEPSATSDPYADWKAKNLQFPLDIPNQYGNQLARWEAVLPDGWTDKDAYYQTPSEGKYVFDTYGMKVKQGRVYMGFRKKPSGTYVTDGTVVLLFDEDNGDRVAAIPQDYMRLVEVVG